MERRVIQLPDRIDLPLAFDLFDQQLESGPDATRIYTYYHNLAEGRLTTTRCSSCGLVHFPPRLVCPECFSADLAFVEVAREGEIFAFTRWDAGLPGIFASLAPLHLAVGRFGPVKLAGRLYGAPEDLKIGDPVTWDVEEIHGPGRKRRYFPCLVVDSTTDISGNSVKT